ncbi:DUF2092 domain-containing protein [Stenotrophomonas sp. HITSZ_GD]|uniref:DUF2092 domain-containing protein n=1 Tax=Stenotrophomonas sp. HITSZ_GD TaxID=3037248 RepID=UPI00240E33E8|nr:DUF2092 domain-containing protein [Stenotrophomonas sp. HITSZ_GD]MDG2525594.1 DUF2092 domain-containing protein [Stenotrophomonas sp. HITSZ_GD]
MPAAAAVDPRAAAALEKMGRYLRSLKNFTVHGDTTLDVVTDDGQKLQFPGEVDYKVRVPDGLRLDWKTDRKERALYYDGKTLTLYGPKNKFYARVEAPPTLHELVAVARDRYGIELPLPDLFLWGTPAAPISALQQATFVGPARIDGSVTEQYAFRQDGVDWQLWLETGDKPLPRRLVITTTTDPAQPQYATTLTWNTSAALKDSTFAFVPPKDAARIELVEVDVAAVEEDQP